jgi:hypothetical protein
LTKITKLALSLTSTIIVRNFDKLNKFRYDIHGIENVYFWKTEQEFQILTNIILSALLGVFVIKI